MFGSLFSQHSALSTQHSPLAFVVFHPHPLAAGGMALQRGLDEGHGARAVGCRRKILFHAGTLAVRDDRIGEVAVPIAERFWPAIASSPPPTMPILTRTTGLPSAKA